MATSVHTVGFEEFLQDKVSGLIDLLPWMKETSMKLCGSIEELREFVNKAIAQGLCCLDLETTGLNTRRDKNGLPKDKIVGLSLAININTGIYIPTRHVEGSEYNLPENLVLEEVKRLCGSCVIIVHHAKFDLQMLKNYGISVDCAHFEDTLILARLYDAGQKEIGLKFLSEKFLNRQMIDFDTITAGSKRFDMVSPHIGYAYAVPDAMNSFGLYEFFIKHPIVIEQLSVYGMEKRLVLVVMQIESNLILIDKPYLQEEKIKLTNRLKDLEQEVHKLVGREFNLASTQQLGKILFKELKFTYPERRKTASGQYMTDTSTLEKIAEQYPIVKKIIEYRETDKTLGTYIEKILQNCDEDGCIKLSFNQSGTETGRFSSPGGQGINADGYGGINVQSIPKDPDGPTDMRRAFVPRPGKKLVAMDFSNEELRVATNLSREPKWIDEFLKGSDLHRATAKLIYRKDDPTDRERAVSKMANFLVMYGGSARALAQKAKISEVEARRILDSFFGSLPTLAKWINNERIRARKAKLARTTFGRVRPLQLFYDSGDKGMEAHADRCAVNFLIQGGCADIMKTVMVRIANWIVSNNLHDEIKILITMHDELVFEINEDKLETYIPKLNNLMSFRDALQGMLKWPVPLTIDAKYGNSWRATNNFFKEHPELEKIEDIKFLSSTQVVEPTIKIPEEPVTSVPVAEALEAQVPAEVLPTLPEETGEFIYRLKNLSNLSVRRLNDILTFLAEEDAKKDYSNPIKLLKLRDRGGNVLSVSNIKVRSENFVVLARFMGL